MTEETVLMAERVLAELGFTDEREDHPWNCAQFVKNYGWLDLVVWGRVWSGLIVQIHGDGYEDVVGLLETEDEAELVRIVKKADKFLFSIAAMRPEEAEEKKQARLAAKTKAKQDREKYEVEKERRSPACLCDFEAGSVMDGQTCPVHGITVGSEVMTITESYWGPVA